MDGLGGLQEQGKLVTIQVPLPEDVDGILEVVRSVILKGNIQNITIKNGEPITYQRVVNANEEVAPSESTQGFAELSVSDIIHNVPMDEFDLKDYMLEGLNASGILIWMFVAVESTLRRCGRTRQNRSYVTWCFDVCSDEGLFGFDSA